MEDKLPTINRGDIIPPLWLRILVGILGLISVGALLTIMGYVIWIT